METYSGPALKEDGLTARSVTIRKRAYSLGRFVFVA